MKKNKVLYVATVDMFTKTGGGLVTYAYYQAFRSIFKDRLVLMHAEDYCPQDFVDSMEDKGGIILSPRRSLFVKCYHFVLGHVHRFYPDILKFLQQHKDEFSECIINGGVYGGDSIQKIRELDISVTIIHHNLEREYHMDNKTIASFWGLSPIWVNHWERISYLNADRNIFLTKYDMDSFSKIYGRGKGNNHLIGSLFPDINQMITPCKIDNNNIKIISSGALNFPQSNQAIIQFYKEILLKLDEYHKFNYIITGRNPSQEIVRLAQDERIILVPSPDNIYEVIKEGDIYVCPL